MVKIFKNITKSKEDKRDYRGLILDNDLRVLLISDPKIDKASAALSVNIGELSDPQELCGLAHFLERLLFLGTKKYSDFLTEHDGDGIYTTDMENTTYYFYVAHEHLTGALDIFSQFPLAPLLDETKAKQILDILLQINYDYEKLLRNDQWRLNQFERSISKKNHPYNKFNHGNWQTLGNDPKKNKIDLWKEMLNFHSNYYSPNIMSLVILGKDSLDELQKKAENSFGKIENKSVSLPEWPGHSVGDEQLCKAILAVPIEDTHKLEINFPIADISRHYKGPYRYLSYLLNNKSSGSLLSALKRSRWATNLEATCKSVLRDIAYCFVEIYLTEMGLMNVHDVIDLFFQYINLLQETVNQNHELTIYRDCLKNSYLNFHYRENEDSARDYCMELAENLLKYPVEDVLTTEHLIADYSPDLIDGLIDMLTPNNCRILIFSKHFEQIADQTEKWSRVKYVIRDIPKEMLDNWDFADSNDELEFPQKNEFIPDSLDILRADDEKLQVQDNIVILPADDENPPPHPFIIHETQFVQVWHKKDDEFLLPKSNLIMEMTSTLENLDPLMSNYTKIYVELVNDALAEYLYDANLACLKFDIETSKYGLVVRMGGLDDKQHVLLDKVLQTMLELDFDAEHFEIIKKKHVLSLMQFFKVEPSELAIHCESVCLLEKEWLITEQLISTENLSIGDLKIFMRKFFSVMHIKCLIHGNANKAAAQKLIEVIERNLPENMLPSHLLRPRDMMLNDGCSYVYPVTYDAHKTSCGVIHLQCPPQCIEDNVLLELFVELFKYKNVTLVRNLTGQGVRFMMHSLNHPIYMERKLEHVIFSIKSILEEMSDKEFERCKKDLAGRRLENCKKMIDQTNKYWTEISSQRQCFDRDRLETDYLKTISKTNVMNFYNDYIYAEGAKRRKLAIHLTSTAEGGAGSDSAKLEEIEPLSIFTDEPKQVENVQSFKSGLATYYPQPIPYQDRPGVDSNRQIYLAQKKPFLDIETILS